MINFFWRFAERCGAQFVTLIVSIVLARVLTPSDFGTVSLVMVFITIMQVFVDSGLGTALVQKKNADDLDFSSVFYFNLAVCLVLYVGMFVAAPHIARFYKRFPTKRRCNCRYPSRRSHRFLWPQRRSYRNSRPTILQIILFCSYVLIVIFDL